MDYLPVCEDEVAAKGKHKEPAHHDHAVEKGVLPPQHKHPGKDEKKELKKPLHDHRKEHKQQ